MTFQRLNTRAAKIHGEGIMEVRRRYAKLESYPMIRQALVEMYGIKMSLQQIARIAKGESFAELPLVPTEREVDLTMHVNAQQQKGFEASKEEIQASLTRLQALLAKDNEPRAGVLEILQNRHTPSREGAGAEQTPQSQLVRTVPALEEIEARERAVMGLGEGAGMERLKREMKVEATTQGTKSEAVEKLLEALK